VNPSFEQTLVEVRRQTLVENAKTVELGSERYPVRSTPKRGLRRVDFVFEGNEIRGLEQNPQTTPTPASIRSLESFSNAYSRICHAR